MNLQVFLLGAATLLFACAAAAQTGWVVGVADGDTVTVLSAGNQQIKVRLAGIDAPERGMPFGQRAKQRLSSLVFGREVEVLSNKVDRYGRTVGKVLVQGQDAGLQLIRSGLAWHYRAYAGEQSAEDRVLYADAERLAREETAGLWKERDPVPPWEWRRDQRAARAAAYRVKEARPPAQQSVPY